MARFPYEWDAPDEPSFREEAACEEAYEDYKAECEEDGLTPIPYSDWSTEWHDERAEDARTGAAEARAEEALDRMMYD